MGAKNGILFKTSEALENTGRIQIVALDKTGTITAGRPEVTDVLPAAGRTEDDLLSLAYALEMQSEHPLARAVVSEAEKRHLQPEKVHDFKALSGNGLTASIGTSIVHGGSGSYIGSIAVIPGDLQKKADRGKRLCSSSRTAGLRASSRWRMSSSRTLHRPSGSFRRWELRRSC